MPSDVWKLWRDAVEQCIAAIRNNPECPDQAPNALLALCNPEVCASLCAIHEGDEKRDGTEHE